MHQCEVCKSEVEVYSGDEGTNSYTPCDRRLADLVERYQIPFRCVLCGSLRFPFKATRDVVFVWPDIVEDKIGSIIVPWMAKEELQAEKEIGTVLSVGPGYWDPKGKFHRTQLKVGDRIIYVKDVPWKERITGWDQKKYIVRLMGGCDVVALVIEEQSTKRGEKE